jgi:UDP-N-acetylmuramyl tripeptide synthase
MPPFLTIVIAKLILKVSRWFGRGGGSALPGLVAERIDPGIGSKLARRLRDGSIIVTGTNGKTTTVKVLSKILADAGEQLVVNRAGSNLSRGIVSALIEHASWSGHFAQTRGLFEVDEAAMATVAAMVQPKAIVVLNLFRDQLDRYGELNTTAQLLGKGIAATTAQLYLNADHPLVASLAAYAAPAQVNYFGVEAVPTTKLAHDVTADSNNCPVCGRALDYSRNFFGHIGHYSCPEGHFSRPQPTYTAANLTLEPERGRFTLSAKDHESLPLTINLPGLYNVYNALAAASVTLGIGVASPASIAQSLEVVEGAFGRVEKLAVKGRTLYLLLVKNPTGFNQVIQTFLLQEKQQNLLICINDNFADGRDVSWLWDVAFEELEPQNHHIAVAGLRATDMALRLKYADMATTSITPNAKKALNQFIAQLPEGGTGYIIPTYTAMLVLRKQLGAMTQLKGVWQ